MEDSHQLVQLVVTAPLVAHDLYRFFHAGEEEVMALRGVSVRVDSSETVAVTGPSGSGKSTLLACLAGLDEPSGGTVWIDGRRISRQSQTEITRLRAQHIGMLFQTNNLIDGLTVRENIELVQRLASKRNAAFRDELIDRLGLQSLANRLPAQLSGGEIARVGLGVALANEPAVVLADEPTGELDGETETDVLDLLVDYADQGGAALVVTHSDKVASAARRVIHMEDGVVAP